MVGRKKVGVNEINVYLSDMQCAECKKELEQTPGKRPKVFCNSTCRSNFWQKAKRKELAKVEVKNLNEPTGKPKSPEKKSEINKSVDTTRKAYNPFDNPRFNSKNK